MSDEGKLRVFFALMPSYAESVALSAWQARFGEVCGGRRMRVDTLHTTLVFMGNIERHLLEALKLAAQQVKARSFDLVFDAANYWPHNHIVYASPKVVPPQLTGLVHDLEHNLAYHHIQFDKRKYQPHVTLLRNAQWEETVIPAMDPTIWQVRNFVLLHSMPSANGANYKTLASFGLH